MKSQFTSLVEFKTPVDQKCKSAKINPNVKQLEYMLNKSVTEVKLITGYMSDQCSADNTDT